MAWWLSGYRCGVSARSLGSDLHVRQFGISVSSLHGIIWVLQIPSIVQRHAVICVFLSLFSATDFSGFTVTLEKLKQWYN